MQTFSACLRDATYDAEHPIIYDANVPSARARKEFWRPGAAEVHRSFYAYATTPLVSAHAKMFEGSCCQLCCALHHLRMYWLLASILGTGHLADYVLPCLLDNAKSVGHPLMFTVQSIQLHAF